MKKGKAVFLDRDGTINVDLDHVFERERVVLIEGAATAIGDLCRAGYLVIVVTNQSCIGRGYARPEQVDDANTYLQELLLIEDKDARITEFKIAPDHPEQATQRRKPGPGMILEAAKDHAIDLAGSWIVGDKVSDPMAGLNAGIPVRQCVLLRQQTAECCVNGKSADTGDKFPALESLRKVVNELIIRL